MKRIVLILLRNIHIDTKFLDEILTLAFKDNSNALTEKFKEKIIKIIS